MCVRLKKRKSSAEAETAKKGTHKHKSREEKKKYHKLRYSGGGSRRDVSQRRLASDRVAQVINYLYNWPIVDDDDVGDGDKLVAAVTLSLFSGDSFLLFLSLLRLLQILILLLRCDVLLDALVNASKVPACSWAEGPSRHAAIGRAGIVIWNCDKLEASPLLFLSLLLYNNHISSSS
jgi:hypothetical protein